MKDFDLDLNLSANDAKHDRIDLDYDHRQYTAPEEDIAAFRHHLSTPPKSGRGEDSGDYFGRIFCRASNRVRHPLAIRRSERKDGTTLPRPLFSGACCFHNSYPSTIWLTELKLSLNPTRFLRNQTLGFIPPRRQPTSTSASFFEQDSVDEGDEFSLDNNDNWLPNTRSFHHDGRLWPRTLRTYLHGVIRTIDADMQRAASLENIQLSSLERIGLKRYRLNEAETYFDFLVKGITPIRLVASLEPYLHSFGGPGVTTLDYPTPSGCGWDKNSRSVTVRLREGVRLKVYAKTNRRVRFEVLHDYRNAFIRLADGSHRRARTFATIDAMIAILGESREEAVTIVNKVLKHIRNQVSLPASSKNAIHLLIDLTLAVPDEAFVVILLDTLIEKGSIVSLPRYRPHLAKLRGAGILEAQEQNHRKEHVVTERYRHALYMLKTHAAFPHLWIRHRTRSNDPSRVPRITNFDR